MSRVRSSPVRSPARALRIAAVVAALLMGSAVVGTDSALGSPHQLQETEPSDEEPFDGRSTEDTVRVVVGSLMAIAGATALLMLGYIWHTSPRRRLRAATRRAEQGRSRIAIGNDTEIVVADVGFDVEAGGKGVTAADLGFDVDDRDPTDEGDGAETDQPEDAM